MQYFLLFLEGIITFISPCLLPLLPVYVSYFAGGEKENEVKPLINAVGFVLGFSVVFVPLGAFAGTIGSFLVSYRKFVNVCIGLIIILFGMNYLGVIKFQFFQTRKIRFKNLKPSNFLSAIIFGVVFSIAWTPCVGAFLASALLRAAGQGTAHEGMLMLFVYSMGLGLPFIASAVLIDKLKSTFGFIKNNYRVINILSGSLLVLIGILIMTGIFEKFMRWFS